MKLFFLSGVSVGVFMGIFFLIFGLAGWPVEVNIGDSYYTGLGGGVLGFFMAPLITGAIFAWFALLAYLPHKLFLKIFKRTRFTVFSDETIENLPLKDE